MKKKILMMMFALFMFIPLTIVKASDITIDKIITKFNERIGIDNTYSYGDLIGTSWSGTNITAQKEGENRIKVSATTDLSGAYANWPEGFVDDEDMSFTSFVIYEYQNSVLSFKGEFGYINADNETINYKTAEKDEWAELLSNQNVVITRELLYTLCNLKTSKNDTAITEYLESNGLEQIGGRLLFPTTNLPAEITIAKDGDGWVTEYSINLDEINIPDTTNNETNTGSNDNTPNQNNNSEEDKKIYEFKTLDNKFFISFEELKGLAYNFAVDSLEQIKKLKQETKNNDEVKTIDEVISKLKKELKDNGTFIDLYSITVTKENQEKTNGTFTFKIKITPEMKKFDTYELINIVDNKKTNDIVKMKVEGDYLVGELPHLSEYALVGKNTENPKTGVEKYIIPGSMLLFTTLAVYALYKKKTI